MYVFFYNIKNSQLGRSISLPNPPKKLPKETPPFQKGLPSRWRRRGNLQRRFCASLLIRRRLGGLGWREIGWERDVMWSKVIKTQLRGSWGGTILCMYFWYLYIYIFLYHTRWWFQSYVCCLHVDLCLGHDSIWLIFPNWFETTNVKISILIVYTYII